MKQVGYSLFETPLGVCGIAWSEVGDARTAPAVVALQFPERTTRLTEARIARVSGGKRSDSPPQCITDLAKRVCLHLAGDLQDFEAVAVDLSRVGSFARNVYKAARKIPWGKTCTYGELAKMIGRPAAARAVGQALGRNPIGLIVPCHRVTAAGGKSGGFSAHGGLATKARLLAIEGTALRA